MGELEDMADHVVVVGRGKVLADGGVDELIARASADQVLLRSPVPEEASAALQQAGVTASVTGRRTVTVSGVPAQRAVEVLSRAGIAFTEVSTARATLEDVYLQLTGGAAEYRATSGAGAER